MSNEISFSDTLAWENFVTDCQHSISIFDTPRVHVIHMHTYTGKDSIQVLRYRIVILWPWEIIIREHVGAMAENSRVLYFL